MNTPNDQSKICQILNHFLIALSLIVMSQSMAVAVWAQEPSVPRIRLAQARFTADQLPQVTQPARIRLLNYGDRIRGTLDIGSLRYQNRPFAIYHFDGEAGQLVRINVVGGSAVNRQPNQLQFGTLLTDPVVILVDPNGEIVDQQPEQASLANALIRKTLPTTGRYRILVTSGSYGSSGRYTLTLRNVEPTE